MIARMWHGVTLVENSEAFLEYMKNTGVTECAVASGNQGVYVLRRSSDLLTYCPEIPRNLRLFSDMGAHRNVSAFFPSKTAAYLP